MQWLHTSVQPLHTSFDSSAFTPTFAPYLTGLSHRSSYMATKQEIENKKSLARALFMSGMEMTEIADKVGVSRVTVSKWLSLIHI